MTKPAALHTETGCTTYTQTYSTADPTVPAATAAAVATTASTNSTPYGFTTSTQADAIVATLNALVVDVLAIRKCLNAVIDDLQLSGMVD